MRPDCHGQGDPGTNALGIGRVRRARPLVLPLAIVLLLFTAATSTAQPVPYANEAATDRSDLARTALELDHQGRHAAAAEIIRLMREQDPVNAEAALLEVENQYWYFMYDTPGVRDDDALRVSIEESMQLAEAQLEADPRNYHARSVYGRALMDDARRLAMMGSYYGAGTRSEKARKILEDVVANRPEDTEARYQLGNYYYWSSVMPAALRAMDWLWFIPKGNRVLGLEFLETVAASDGPHADSANMVLSVVEMYHAPERLESSEARIRRLRARYPQNVLIHYEFLELLFLQQRYDELLEEAQRLIAREREPQPIRAHALMARSWPARVALERGRTAEALGVFDELAGDPDVLPNWGPAWIDLMRGQALDALGRRREALVAYQRVLDYEGERKTPRAMRQAERLIETPFDPTTFRPQPLALSGD